MTHGVKTPEAKRRRQRSKRRRGKVAQQWSRKLARGEQIRHAGDHHAGMRILVADRLGPCPEGKELSLVNEDSSYCYFGRSHGKDYLLSTDPTDYEWETHEENLARQSPSA